jgi:hypothetical protein
MFLGANVHRSDGRRIRVLGAYLPAAISDKPFNPTLGTIEQESNTEERPLYSIATKVWQYLFSVVNLRRFPTANSWFWYRMSKMVQDSEWECILAGDFNREWPRADSTSPPSDFQKAAGGISLSTPTADALRALGDLYRTSIYDGRFCKGIDHVLLRDPATRRSTSCRCPRGPRMGGRQRSCAHLGGIPNTQSGPSHQASVGTG